MHGLGFHQEKQFGQMEKLPYDGRKLKELFSQDLSFSSLAREKKRPCDTII